MCRENHLVYGSNSGFCFSLSLFSCSPSYLFVERFVAGIGVCRDARVSAEPRLPCGLSLSLWIKGSEGSGSFCLQVSEAKSSLIIWS
jgi:hypothetical protein